jgi:hypothetical protein
MTIDSIDNMLGKFSAQSDFLAWRHDDAQLNIIEACFQGFAGDETVQITWTGHQCLASLHVNIL